MTHTICDTVVLTAADRGQPTTDALTLQFFATNNNNTTTAATLTDSDKK